MTETPTDFPSVKKAQRAGWESGDYAKVGCSLQIIAERLVEAADVRPGERALDVACGQGNAAIAAALRFTEATGVDYATNLLGRGEERAAAENVPVSFVEGDAEELPFPDRSFDLVMSTIGVMFAPDHQRAADELVRVTEVGGRIALASWTPDGMVGELFRTVGAWAPPPAGALPASLWGTEDHLAALFGDRVEWTFTKQEYVFRYLSPEHFSEWIRRYYGPVTLFSGTLTEENLTRFSADVADVARRYDKAAGPTIAAPAEYLQAVGVRRS